MRIGFSSVAPAVAVLSLLVLAPAARAQDFGWDTACDASPGISSFLATGFSLTAADSGGGCHPFRNDTGRAITSIVVQTLLVPGSTPPSADGTGSYNCNPTFDPRKLFSTCTISFDPGTDILTFSFSGSPTFPGIGEGADLDLDLRTCTSTDCGTGAGGGWGTTQNFVAAVNGGTLPPIPEPRMGIFAALSFAGLLLFRRRNSAIQSSK